MIAALSPADYNFDETLSTLRYASRAKNIQKNPTLNQHPTDALLTQSDDSIQELTKLLDQYQNGGGNNSSGGGAAAQA